MICEKCQKVLPEEAQFCSNCGSPRTNPDPRSAETLKQTSTTYDQLSLKTDDHNSPPHDPRIGLVLDSKYQLLDRLGEGGMGSVYRARRLHIGDEVAVKLLSHDLVRDSNAIERFRREARSAAMIRHPNVVSIHDFNDASHMNEAYIVMELVKGESLRKVLEREGRLPPERAVSLMRDVCAGVGVAHRQGLLHRDLKPDNVIVAPASHDGERETAKVVDFGLAKVRDAANLSALTQTGTLLGTLYYMSPEQCRGEELDARADVYSLGAMLYEMLTGTPPFVANNPTGLIAKHLSEAPPAFPQYFHPTPLGESCLRALAKNREERQADAISFGEELQAAMLAPDQSAMSTAKASVPNSVIPQVGQGTRPLKWILAIVAVLVLAVGVLGIAIKVGLDRFASNDKTDQNTENQSTTLPTPTQATGSESLIAPSSATSSDLRGTWSGTYGPLSQPATLVIKNHKGDVIEGVLEQGPVRVVFSGTAVSGSVHLKQTRVLSGEGWSLGEDVGTVSRDGKKMSGTGRDALGESLGMSYQWSFTRP